MFSSCHAQCTQTKRRQTMHETISEKGAAFWSQSQRLAVANEND